MICCKGDGCHKLTAKTYCRAHSVNFKVCMHSGCYILTKAELDKKTAYCKKHQRIKLCEIDKCQIQATFNFPNQKRLRCARHADPGMINVVNPKCVIPNCLTRPFYNFPNETKGTHCRVHHLNGMVDKRNRPNAPEEYTKYAKKSKTDVAGKFSDNNTPICIFDGCNISPSFNYPGRKMILYCKKHKLDGMINIHSIYCEYPGCTVQPSFNFPNLNNRVRCRAHKLEGMEYSIYKNKLGITCRVKKCRCRANYGAIGDLMGTYCWRHKSEDMVIIKSILCTECSLVADYNFPGEIEPDKCARHKLNGMEKVCLIEDIHIPDNELLEFVDV